MKLQDKDRTYTFYIYSITLYKLSINNLSFWLVDSKFKMNKFTEESV